MTQVRWLYFGTGLCCGVVLVGLLQALMGHTDLYVIVAPALAALLGAWRIAQYDRVAR